MPSLPCLHSLVTRHVQISFLCTTKSPPRQSCHDAQTKRAQHPSISSTPIPHAAPQLQPPNHPHAGLWHHAVVPFPGLYAGCCLRQIEDPFVCQPLSWVARGNLLGRGQREWRERNAHMNGLVCAQHLLTEGLCAFASQFISTIIFFNYMCSMELLCTQGERRPYCLHAYCFVSILPCWMQLVEAVEAYELHCPNWGQCHLTQQIVLFSMSLFPPDFIYHPLSVFRLWAVHDCERTPAW